MSRYSTSTTLKSSTGARYFGTVIIPVIPISQNDTYIVITSTERLDKLAHTFYGDASLWWAIATANGIGKGSITVPPESRLRIPDVSAIQAIINDLNNQR
jgi:hypothetical protein